MPTKLEWTSTEGQRANVHAKSIFRDQKQNGIPTQVLLCPLLHLPQMQQWCPGSVLCLLPPVCPMLPNLLSSERDPCLLPVLESWAKLLLSLIHQCRTLSFTSTTPFSWLLQWGAFQSSNNTVSKTKMRRDWETISQRGEGAGKVSFEDK